MKIERDERRFDFHDIGLAIKRACEASGMTQEQLAYIVDRAPRTIMYNENDGQHPSLNTFYQMVTMFDISVDQYFYPSKNRGSECRKRIDAMAVRRMKAYFFTTKNRKNIGQPLVACTLIGLVTGNLTIGIILGGSLQMIALGWANIGAAVAPDAALASVASTIILVQGGQGQKGIGTAIGIAIPLAVAGLFLTMLVRTISVAIVHIMDRKAEEANWRAIDRWQMIAVALQGLRIAIPAALLLAIPASVVRAGLNAMPAWLNEGMTIGGGMVVAVGYAMVINMMASREVWPFFIIGFCLAAVKELTLIALGGIGISLAIMYLALEGSKGGNNNNSNSGSGDPLGDILDDY